MNSALHSVLNFKSINFSQTSNQLCFWKAIYFIVWTIKFFCERKSMEKTIAEWSKRWVEQYLLIYSKDQIRSIFPSKEIQVLDLGFNVSFFLWSCIDIQSLFFFHSLSERDKLSKITVLWNWQSRQSNNSMFTRLNRSFHQIMRRKATDHSMNLLIFQILFFREILGGKQQNWTCL